MLTTEQINKARQVGTPLIAVSTADQPATALAIATKLIDLESGADYIEADGKQHPGGVPVISWDILRGFRPMNKLGEPALAKVLGERPPQAARHPGEALSLALDAEKDTIFVFFNAQRVLDEPMVAQGLMNLRDLFKGNGRSIILLGDSFARLPKEIAQDFFVIDEPLPTRDELRASTAKLYEENEVSIRESALDSAADALAGLAPFPAESAASMAVRGKQNVDLDEMWRRKFRAIENVKGLKMTLPKVTFKDMGGCKAFIEYVELLAAGPCRPRIIVWLDEFEKMISGAGDGGQSPGESTGTAMDQVKVLLTEMERNNWSGDLRVGPPGSGKTQSVQLMAGHLGIPLVEFDLGGVKSKWLGESEEQIRAAIKALFAMGGDGPGVYFAATCNSLSALSAPLRRRFSAPGSTPFMFDLPDVDEREAIGRIQQSAFEKLAGRGIGPRGARWDQEASMLFWKSASGWSGANIRDCCRVAYSLQRTVDQVTIVPAADQDKAGLEKLRTMANGVFLSASYPGTYKMPSKDLEVSKPRRFGARNEVSN